MKGKDNAERWNIIRKYCIRLLKPLAIFEIINIILPAVWVLKDGPEKLVSYGIDALKSAVLYPPGALWYLQASIFGALLIGSLMCFFSERKVMIIGGLYAFALLCNNYFFVTIKNPIGSMVNSYLKWFETARNGLFVGFPLLMVGIHMSYTDFSFVRRRKIQVLSMFMFIIEVLALKGRAFADDGSLYVSHLIIAPLLLYFAINVSVGIKQETSILLRNLSTGMYFLHRIVLYVTVCVMEIMQVSYPLWVLFPITLLISCMVCLIAYKQPVVWIRELFR